MCMGVGGGGPGNPNSLKYVDWGNKKGDPNLL
jgi:hypothetical protein